MNAILHAADAAAAPLAAALIRGAILLAVVAALAWPMRRLAAAATRHWLWAIACVGLLAVPLLSIRPPSWRVLPPAGSAAWRAVPVAIREATVSPPLDSSRAPALAPPIAPAILSAPPPSARPQIARAATTHASAAGLAVIAWALVAAWLLGRLLVAAALAPLLERRCARLADGPLLARAERLAAEGGVRRPVRWLLAADDDAMPRTWGVFRPRVLLPRDGGAWSGERIEAVLRHELAHVARRDCLTLLIARAARALHWPNPLAWLAVRRMGVEQERACDDRVLCAGTPAPQYAETLMTIAERSAAPAVGIAMARPSQLEARLLAILDSARRRRAAMRPALAGAIALAIACVAVAVVALRAAQAEPAKAIIATTKTTSTTAAASRPALPDAIAEDRVALRVLGPDGAPIEIDDITTITLTIVDGQWSMGPKPQVIDRFADGWVTVDASMYALRYDAGQATQMTIVSGGATLAVDGAVPPKGGRRIEYASTISPSAAGVDFTTGPADVAADEVAGRVVDPNGRPVAGAIASFPSDWPADSPARPPEPRATTDADGVFRFHDFARRGFTYFKVEVPGYASRLLVDVPIGRGFTIRLDDRTRLRGDLTLPDGTQAAGATIELSTSKPTARPRMASPINSLTQTFVADARGHYDVPIEPGTYDARITSADGNAVARHAKFAVPAGAATALPAQLGAGQTLTLRLIDTQTGKPVAGATLAIQEQRPGVIYPRPGTQRTSDANGVATWEHVPAGTESIRVRASGYSSWFVRGKREWWARGIDDLNVTVAPSMPTVIVDMTPAIIVRGVVLAPDGKPVANATVDIAGMWTGDTRYEKRTDAQGRFELQFPNLNLERSANPSVASSQPAPSDYAIVAFDQSGNWANALSETFTPRAGDRHDVTIRMSLGGRVTGRVVDSNGKPVAGIEVEAVPDDRMDRSYYDPRQVTDAEGRFDLGPMRPTTYALVPDTNFGVNVAGDMTSATKVTVVDDTERSVTLLYDGPPAPPVPENYFNHGGNRRIAATTRPARRE